MVFNLILLFVPQNRQRTDREQVELMIDRQVADVLLSL